MKTLALLLISLVSAHAVFAQQKPVLSETDRVRIAEAFRIGDMLGNRVWKNWDKAPFALLLVTPENEFLIRHPRPSSDFVSIGYDSLLKSEVYSRKRTFSPDRLATFPAVGGISTIVIGQAKNTSKKTSTEWVTTVLHEHFHQLQSSQPSYYDDVNALNLSGGDQTGMWMLNYPFPYATAEISQRFDSISRMLAAILEAKSKKQFTLKTTEYLAARRKLQIALKIDDFKYLSFQLWQEGIARYTELQIAELAAKSYKPTNAFRSLKDYKPFKTVAKETRANILKELNELKLADYQRVAFYPIGAGEAMLLDKANPKWKTRYFVERFSTEKYFSSPK